MLVVRVSTASQKSGRQLEVRTSLSLYQVHQILQTAFGWEDDSCLG